MNSKERELQLMIAEDLAKFVYDPISYVLWAFPWGKGALRGFTGPRKWQEEFLGELGDLAKDRAFDGVHPVEPIQMARASGHGIGKALCAKDTVPTPLGIKTVEDIKEGDYLFGEEGKKVKVFSTKRYEDCPFYKVTFSDNSSIEVSTGHLWKVKGRQERRQGLDSWRVLSTKELLALGVKRPNGVKSTAQWEIPKNKKVEYPDKRLGVDPYIYGVWLGDGDKRSGRITNKDQEVWDLIGRVYNHKPIDLKENYVCTPYGLCSDLKKEGLFGCTTYSASIDRRYIESGQRLEVLQGLLDTDGWVENSCGAAAFCSSSRQLVRDVIEVARSLGLIARQEKFKPNACAGAWVTHITWDGETQLFKIKRKQEALICPSQDRYFKRWITKIEPIGNKLGICFQVNGELFLTKDYHVTHNSANSSWVIKWILDTRPFSKGVVTANTSDQLRTKTWAEVGKWHFLSLTKHMFEYHATKGNMNLVSVENPEQWRCDAMTSREENSEAFAGLHAASSTPFFLFDEASAIPEKIFEVAQGGLTDGEPMFFQFGNPTRNTGFFRSCFGKLAHRWKTKQIDSRTVEGTNKELMSKWVEDYGEDSDFVRVRVRGTFPRAAVCQLISGELVTNAVKNKLHFSKYDFAPKILGVDVAWYGDDRNAIFLRQGLAAKLLWQGREVDSVDVAGLVAQYEDEHGTDATFIDAGMGNGVIDQLRRLGRNPIPVYFGGKSNNPQYLNKRSQMWGDMKDWLKLGAMIPDISELFDDLTGPEYFMTLKGQVQLEKKEDMKKRGLSSPDLADALALTFSDPVYKASSLEGIKGLQYGNVGKVKTEYDLFD